MHKGQEVQKMVSKMGMTIAELSEKTGKARNTLYGYFGDPNLGRKQIETVGEAISFDFSKIFGDYSDIDPKDEEVQDSLPNIQATSLMVMLDGNDANFEKTILRLRALNDTLKRF
jgi:lambda repressor-like predicted transcriptional regulator